MSNIRRVKINKNGKVSGSDLGNDLILQANNEGELQGYGMLNNDTAIQDKAGKTLTYGTKAWEDRARRTAAAIKAGEFDLKNVKDPKMYNYIQGIIGAGGEEDVRDFINNVGVKTALGTLAVPATIIGGKELYLKNGGILKRVSKKKEK